MNILRNAGTHKILAIMQGANGESPLELIEMAGRTAYQSRDKITPDSAKKFVKMLIDRGHESVLEHSSMTVEFNGCSRGFCNELVRHRLMSITQESTRYIDESNFNVVMPPNQTETETVELDLGHTFLGDVCVADWLELNENVYKQLRAKDWAAQDARQVLPIGIKSQIVCTANFREWRHIFKMRTAQTAHWEIRRVLSALLLECHIRVPIVFDDIWPQFTTKEAQDWGWDVEESPTDTNGIKDIRIKGFNKPKEKGAVQ